MAEEGKKHPIGNYEVKVQEVTIEDTKRLLCQKCTAREQAKARKKNAALNKSAFQRIFGRIFN
ncbi:hypothetical protein [Gracilimonas mengyeensis]|nr:hypothetical protein [Gracilimonas mengyeensis]